MNCMRHTVVNERSEDYADFCAGCERGDECYCEDDSLCRYHADIDRLMEDAGYYDDAEPCPPFPNHDPNCHCHLRGGKRAWCGYCLTLVNERGFISIDTLLYLLWCCFWAVMIFQPWEKV